MGVSVMESVLSRHMILKSCCFSKDENRGFIYRDHLFNTICIFKVTSPSIQELLDAPTKLLEIEQ